MSATETTAAMTSPAEPDGSIPPDTGAQSVAASAAPATVPEPLHDREAERRTVSPNVVISVLGGFIAALLTALSALMVVQFNSLGNRIDNLGTELRAEIGSLRNETQGQFGSLRAEIGSLRNETQGQFGSLRAEMRAGFREINAILHDHTDRLARLEAAAGLPPPTTQPPDAPDER